MKNIWFVFLGGGLGSILRYVTYVLFPINLRFPWPTFTVNFIGSLLVGMLSGYILKSNDAADHIRLFMVTGFCGGFTTFSAFSLDLVKLAQQQQWIIFLIYAIASLIIGVLGCWIGLVMVK